ncbi:hypothetical protein TL5118_01749 [Thalassovita autumnalis]|uniref:Uncharacterized protein n=1 Tax=Thalassovita autumnalis TaxID=2072972 RepID=A0A0P1FXW9_9RHOB|nr:MULTISPECIES: hypothetical protein [Thalassovita]CUH66420.1 hypothetical protein TL5118_01749 [Thalassovita autumnalis]CUH71196.1 hypothetical protein TL5120_00982 [Thalassovita autumnalis]
MIKTIVIGKYVSVQGCFVKHLPGGKMMVRVGNRLFAGTPVKSHAA